MNARRVIDRQAWQSLALEGQRRLSFAFSNSIRP
jgi:hypothetical protein